MKVIPMEVTRVIGRTILHVKKDSPRLLFAAGVVGVTASAVMACKATLKLDDAIGDFQKEVDDLKYLKENPGNYPVQEYKRDLAYVYVNHTVKVVRLYAPSVLLGAASIGALTGSHITLTRRNASLTAAYATLDKAFNEYQQRVKEELGEEKEFDLRHGKAKKMEIEGEKDKQLARVSDGRLSPYAKFFDQSSAQWKKNAELNRMFLQVQQNYANHLLQARGHVFLNDVYDMLDLPRTSPGAVVGWVWGENGKDQYIDFGIYDERNYTFVNQGEPTVLLDFNVDGVIYELI